MPKRVHVLHMEGLVHLLPLCVRKKPCTGLKAIQEFMRANWYLLCGVEKVPTYCAFHCREPLLATPTLQVSDAPRFEHGADFGFFEARTPDVDSFRIVARKGPRGAKPDDVIADDFLTPLVLGSLVSSPLRWTRRGHERTKKSAT